MSIDRIFTLQLVLGYLAWLLVFKVFVWSERARWNRLKTLQCIAALHSFRFFGLVFLVPGAAGVHLPLPFAMAAAYGDLLTGVLAMAALAAMRSRRAFVVLSLAYNLIGVADLLNDYKNAVLNDLPASAGELGMAYFVPVIYVPALMISHGIAIYLLARWNRNPEPLAA